MEVSVYNSFSFIVYINTLYIGMQHRFKQSRFLIALLPECNIQPVSKYKRRWKKSFHRLKYYHLIYQSFKAWSINPISSFVSFTSAAAAFCTDCDAFLAPANATVIPG